MTANPNFQSPEFLRLFETYTASADSIGAKMTHATAEAAPDAALIVATAADFILFPGRGRPPEVEGYRLTTRGFKELAAVSHLGPALASLVRLRELDPEGTLWRSETERLLAATVAAREANSVALWCDDIAVPAYRGRETAITNMVHYACEVTERYIARALAHPETLTAADLRTHYLEATGDAIGASVPMNKVMIATFFLVGLDTGHRVIAWFERHRIDWANAMVLIVGRQGRPTAGVTWSTNAVCSMILASSHHALPLERVYIAPHAPAPTFTYPVDLPAVSAHEAPMRKLWWATRAMSDLGPMMYEGYPRFAPGRGGRPVLQPDTTEVSEMPAIGGPEDWHALNTRMRVILEDPRQLLAGCVTDYAADQLQGNGNDPLKAVVPGLDGTDYPAYFS
ncbi:DUF5624 domain-containing protein [Variovorax sp. OV084]|jgi:hypothetical protein|uniref:DUF5624 domain-containing protein n=1 Tax=Variovorax sp. OV084 TaxID=1882777 RepID=UPI0008D3A1BF|nr:DUF5624 domain-containing protein [Variovorax sp. OV084]SET14529.1 hypothetical protein SAMN05443580_10272 [Variovorax sp. OV084]